MASQTADYDIVGSYNNQRVSSIDSERSVNLFEYVDPLGKKPKILLPTSGLANASVVLPLTSGGYRAQFVYKEFMYVVAGPNIFRVDSNLTPVLLGSFATTSGYVGIDANDHQVLFVDGNTGCLYDTTLLIFTQDIRTNADSGFPQAPIDVCFIDGFFVVAHGGTNEFEMSGFNDGLSWSSNSSTFTTDSQVFTTNFMADNNLIIASATGYTTGIAVTVYNSGGALPNPLVAATTYYVIAGDATHIALATTLANALLGIPITLTSNSTGTSTVLISDNLLVLASTANFPSGIQVQVTNSGGALPAPLTIATDYYIIRISSTTIELATSLANVGSNTPIVLTSGSTGTSTITTTGQLQLGTISSHPGNIVACRTLHRRIFFFSEYYTEVWENNGVGTNLPLRRNNSYLIEYGTPAIGSVATGFDKLFFLSQTRDGLGSMMEVQGTQAQPISGRALDFQLARYAADPLNLGVTDARAFIIKENGLIFYRLNFTKANHTYIYNDSMSDEQNKRWHEEEILNGNRHPTQTHAYYNGVNYAGHYSIPTLYVVSSDLSTNDGESIRRMRIGRPYCPPNYHRLRIDRFQLDLLQGSVLEVVSNPNALFILTQLDQPLLTQLGVNLIIAQSDDPDDERYPEVFFSYSKDGGQTYGPRLVAPMGQIGQRTFRTLWRKLGTTPRGQSFVPKIEFFNNIPLVILGAAWSYEELPE